MLKRAMVLLATTAVIGAVQAAEVSTRGGLDVTSDDGVYSFSLGGRVMWDVDSFDGALNRGNGGQRRLNSDLRRARVEMSGSGPSNFEYRLEVNVNDDGASSDAEIHAAGVSYTGWEFADLFVGRTKEPFGLEELTSSKAISSIERNYFTEATDADSQPHFGVRLDGVAGPVGWSLGVFNPNGNPQNDDGSDRIATSLRVFGTPIADDRRILHLGAAATDRGLDDPEPANGFKLDIAEAGGQLDSSAIVIDDDRQFGLEALYLQGPFSLQGEVFRRDMEGAAGGPDGQVDHQYLQATWTLTGESRGYKAAAGIPDMIKPTGRRGAVELVAKADWIRFEVDGQTDQEVQGYLLGANWYPTAHIKLMANVIRVTSDGVVGPAEDDDATVFSARVQVAF